MGSEPRERWTIDKVREFLGVSKDFVYRKAAAGKLPSYKVGKRLEFDRTDVEAFLASLRRGGNR